MAKSSKSAENQQTKSKLQEALDRLNKEYGQGSVFKIGDNPNVRVAESISTGSLTLDRAIGVNGYPCGRIVEIYGPESSGKTTLCLHAIKEAQLKGKKAAIIDMEHALDLVYAAKIGVDVPSLIFAQPSYGEEALNIAKELAESGEVGIIVIDSVAALVPKSEAEGEVGDSNVGKQARMISQAMRILSPVLESNNVLTIFTNQIRMKIGVMFGSPETTAGGEALKFFASIRLDVRKSVQRDDGEAYGNKITVKVVKNKVSAPFKKAEFMINYGEGIDRKQEVLDLAVENDIILKSGSWFSYKGTKIGQGEDAVKQFLSDNEEVALEIEQNVNSLYGKIKENPKEQEKPSETGEGGTIERVSGDTISLVS